MNAIATAVLQAYTENFKETPQCYFSPGRINLIGEHVDYNDGFVMPAAIDKGVYYAVGLNNSSLLNFYAMDFEERLSIEIEAIEKMDNWKNYVLSVVNEFVLLGADVKGFNCVFAGDIPRGSGMSSSAAVEGGLAFALNELYYAGLDRVALAQLCQRAEHNFPGVKCGIMDQFANMMGLQNQVLLLDCQSLTTQYFPLQLNGYKIVLLNSKVAHTLASGEYNIRRQRCEEGMAIVKSALPIASFRDIESLAVIQNFKSSMNEKVYNCCQFVVEEIARTQKAAILLQQQDIAGFGQLMFATHEGLSKLYEVSCPELDFLVAHAKPFSAVIGSRLMGGGFGGCTINIVADAGIDDFIAQSTAAYQQQFGIALEAYVVNTGDGTRAI